MEEPERDFYENIVRISNRGAHYKLLSKDMEIIAKTIMWGYKKNIKTAALSGLNEAYICIYGENARYKGIPIDQYVRNLAPLREKLEENEIEPLMDVLRRKLAPFLVEVEQIPADKDYNVFAVKVKWGDS